MPLPFGVLFGMIALLWLLFGVFLVLVFLR